MPFIRSTTTKAIASLLVILTLAHVSLANPISRRSTGTMTIVTTCLYPVWYQIVPQNGGNPAWKLLSPSRTFPWTTYSPLSPTNCEGLSIRLGTKNFNGLTPEPITQVEVAWNSSSSSVIYDVSDLNSYGPSPFFKQGYVLYANEAASNTFALCNTIHCGSGENPCRDLYWYGMY
jgi:hypothetical protein